MKKKIPNKEINKTSCRLDDFLKIVKGDFVFAVNGKKIAGQSIDAGIYGNYGVVSAEVENEQLLIGLKP